MINDFKNIFYPSFLSGFKNRVLVGYLFIVLVVLSACVYGLSSYKMLEKKMVSLNGIFIPVNKAMEQVDASFAMFEIDLDRSIEEGVMRPRENLDSILLSRLAYFKKTIGGTPEKSAQLLSDYEMLFASYNQLNLVLNKMYFNWTSRDNYSEELSISRANFRASIKALMRNLERQNRITSFEVQNKLAKTGVFFIFAIIISTAFALMFAYWLVKSLEPVDRLGAVMKDISANGLQDIYFKELANIPERGDEIGFLTKQTLKMADSLRSKNEILEDQKRTLERAHSDLASQNIELRKTQNQLQHSEKLGLVGKMAAQMAHEIRNPLNALNLHVELLEHKQANENKSREEISLIKNEVNRLIAITDSYLSLAKSNTNKSMPLEVNTAIEEVYDLFFPLMESSGIQFTCDLDRVPTTFFNKQQIIQVMSNLIKNSYESFENTNKKNKYIKIFSSFDSIQNKVKISVLDNGSGMSKDLQKQIFSPFMTSKSNGTGLGLAFSKQLIETSGGEISFTSAVEAGSQFKISLPVYQIERQLNEFI